MACHFSSLGHARSVQDWQLRDRIESAAAACGDSMKVVVEPQDDQTKQPENCMVPVAGVLDRFGLGQMVGTRLAAQADIPKMGFVRQSMFVGGQLTASSLTGVGGKQTSSPMTTFFPGDSVFRFVS